MTPRPFLVDGPLPGEGRMVIEASAGTGKTFALAALATRLVADGVVAVDQLLVVTFTRAAAAELRDRVRRRLVEAARCLADPAVSVTSAGDQVHRVLLDAPEEVVRARLGRLEAAVAAFDTATITTIHGFCNQVLLTLGVTGHHNPEAVLVQDTRDVVTAVCTDLLAAEALADRAPCKVGKLAGWVTCLLNNPGVEVVARSAKESDEEVARLVVAAAEQVRRRLVDTGSVSYDGLLTTVQSALRARPQLAARLAAQFPVALVDEFQDTDPVQWDIFRTISALPGGGDGPGTRLILVGDPKQAIYGFRGGDIHTYLEAAEGASRLTLPTNWRSDGALVDAMNALCADLALGDDRIRYLPVTATPDHQERRLTGRDGTPLPAVDVRCVVDPALNRTSRGIEPQAALRASVTDLVERIQGLLGGGALVEGREVTPGDIAVLVHANRWGIPVQRALARRGIPAVITGGSSVVDAPAAEQWRILIDALVRPADPTRARAVAVSWFFGWPAERVAATCGPAGGQEEDDLASLQASLEAWTAVLRSRGVAALVADVWRESGVAARVLAAPGGERNLTDLDHLGELLHAASGGRPIGPEALRALLDGLEAGEDDEDPEAIKRRIDTDDAAVKIMTLHSSKGLEFPVVCVPSLWNLRVAVSDRLFHDEETGERLLDVSASSGLKDVKPAHAAAGDEIRGQNARLAYVGLTRARHQTIVWWSPAGAAATTTLADVLFGTAEGKRQLPPPEDTVAVIRRRVADLGATEWVQVGQVPPEDDPASTRTAAPPAPPPVPDTGGADAAVEALRVALLDRPPDRSAGRWSFTAMARRATGHDVDAAGPPPLSGVPAGVDPDDASLGDGGDGDEQIPPPPVLFDGLGAGAAFGTMVHDALEHVDFTADVPDLLTDYLGARVWSTSGPDTLPGLVAALTASVQTPLGEAFGNLRLADIGGTDRLDELEFEMPLGVGAVVPLAAVGRLVHDALTDQDPLRAWAADLADGLIEVDLGGFLTGSIDAVLRLPGDRFCVVDYKTNRLGRWGVPDVVANYHPDLLPAAMAEHHYPLQALLYSVALHRYLRWRLDGYRPDRHLGPVGYLFLRGMVGERTPVVDGRRHGVFAWSPPPGLVVALSDLLHRGVGPEAA